MASQLRRCTGALALALVLALACVARTAHAAPCVCQAPAPCQFEDSVTCSALVGGRCSPGSQFCTDVPPPTDDGPLVMRAGYPSTSHVSGTGAGFNLMTSAPGWAYLVVTLAGTDAPPPPRVVDGAWDGVVAKAMLALGAADTVAGVTVAGLTQETDYTVYFVLEDINGVLTADTVAMSLTTPRVAPLWLHDYPHVVSVTDHDVELAAALVSSGVTVHVVVVARDEPAPSAQNVVDGVDASGAPALGVGSLVTGEELVEVKALLGMSLPQNMALDLYAVGRAGDGVTPTTRKRQIATAVDTDAPSFLVGYPLVEDLSPVGFKLVVLTNEAAAVFVLVRQSLPGSEPRAAPTSTQVIGNVDAGVDGSVWATEQVAGADVPVTVTVADLAPDAATTVYLVLVDADLNQSPEPVVIEMATPEDPNASTITAAVNTITSTGAHVVITATYPGDVLMLVLPAANVAPTAAEVRTHANAAAVTLVDDGSGAGAGTGSVSGLTAETDYALYVAAVDGTANANAPVAVTAFVTQAAAVPPVMLEGYPTVTPAKTTATVRLAADQSSVGSVVVLPASEVITPQSPQDVWTSAGQVTVALVSSPTDSSFAGEGVATNLQPGTAYVAWVALRSTPPAGVGEGVDAPAVFSVPFETIAAPSLAIVVDSITETGCSVRVADSSSSDGLIVHYAVVPGATASAPPSAADLVADGIITAVATGTVSGADGSVAGVDMLVAGTSYVVYAVGVNAGDSGEVATEVVVDTFSTLPDATPPSWLDVPAITDTTSTAARVRATLSETATVYVVVFATGSGPLMSAASVIVAAQTATGVQVAQIDDDNRAIAAAAVLAVPFGEVMAHWVEGLALDRDYVLQVAAIDSAGVVQPQAFAVEFATSPDTSPPEFAPGFPRAYPVAATQSSVAIEVLLLEDGVVHWAMTLERPIGDVPTSAVVDGVIEGTAAVATGTLSVTADTAAIVTAAGAVAPDTEVHVALIAEDVHGNRQAVASIVSASTLQDLEPPGWEHGMPQVVDGMDDEWPRLQVALDEPGVAYVMVVAIGSIVPSLAQVVTGSCPSCSVASTLAVDVPNAGTMVEVGLRQYSVRAVAYDVYVVAVDARNPPNVQPQLQRQPMQAPDASLLGNGGGTNGGDGTGSGGAAGQEVTSTGNPLDSLDNPAYLWGTIALVALVMLFVFVVVARHRERQRQAEQNNGGQEGHGSSRLRLLQHTNGPGMKSTRRSRVPVAIKPSSSSGSSGSGHNSYGPTPLGSPAMRAVQKLTTALRSPFFSSGSLRSNGSSNNVTGSQNGSWVGPASGRNTPTQSEGDASPPPVLPEPAPPLPNSQAQYAHRNRDSRRAAVAGRRYSDSDSGSDNGDDDLLGVWSAYTDDLHAMEAILEGTMESEDASRDNSRSSSRLGTTGDDVGVLDGTQPPRRRRASTEARHRRGSGTSDDDEVDDAEDNATLEADDDSKTAGRSHAPRHGESDDDAGSASDGAGVHPSHRRRSNASGTGSHSTASKPPSRDSHGRHRRKHKHKHKHKHKRKHRSRSRERRGSDVSSGASIEDVTAYMASLPGVSSALQSDADDTAGSGTGAAAGAGARTRSDDGASSAEDRADNTPSPQQQPAPEVTSNAGASAAPARTLSAAALARAAADPLAVHSTHKIGVDSPVADEDAHVTAAATRPKPRKVRRMVRSRSSRVVAGATGSSGEQVASPEAGYSGSDERVRPAGELSPTTDAALDEASSGDATRRLVSGRASGHAGVARPGQVGSNQVPATRADHAQRRRLVESSGRRPRRRRA